jgi:dihydroorotate dehydrogenase
VFIPDSNGNKIANKLISYAENSNFRVNKFGRNSKTGVNISSQVYTNFMNNFTKMTDSFEINIINPNEKNSR